MATLYILYGSATGNAEHIAKDLASKTPPAPFTSIKCDEMGKFKKYSAEWLVEPKNQTTVVKKHGLILITSTTGNGDAPENASRFVRYLKRKTTIDIQPFQHCAFAVLGLGDTNYDQFCASGKLVDKKMVELGGTRAKTLAMADEATGLEDVVEPWVETVIADMVRACSTATTTTTPLQNNNTKSETTASSPANHNITNKEETTSKPNKEPEPTTPSTTAQEPAPATTSPADELKTSITAPQQQTKTKQPEQESSANNTAPVVQVVEPTSTKSSSPLFILYGSATGNAEQIAKDLASTYQTLLQNPISNCYFPDVICCELDQYKKKKCMEYWEQPCPSSSGQQHQNKKHGVLIVTSTTGNGDAPENASRFCRFIKRKTTIDSMPFQHCAYAVLGLGDTNYDQFCATGKLIDKKLFELGGIRAKDLAIADEGTGCLEDVVEPWTSSILLDITNACRGSILTGEEEEPTTPTRTNRPSADSSTSATANEEKKMELVDAVQPPTTAAAAADIPSQETRGVETICSLLAIASSSDAFPVVDHSSLPALGTSLSSCELVHDEQVEDIMGARRRSRGMSFLSELDQMTVSTASSTAVHYTISRPYETTILDARYLTNTKTDAAKSVSQLWDDKSSTDDEDEKIMQSVRIFNDHFPLGPSDGTDAEDSGIFDRNGKRVIEMTLSLPDDFTLEYQPGDSLGLLVPNTPSAVQFVLSMLRQHHNIAPTQKVSVDSKHPISVEDAVRHHIDLCSPLKNKRILHSLSQFATDVDEERALRLLASKTPQGEELFRQYIDEQRLSVVDVLSEFPSTQNIPLEGLLGILPGIPPRYYSVSCSPLAKQTLSLTVAFSVVDYLTPSLVVNGNKNYGERRIGGIATRYLEVLCSPFLSGSECGSHAPKLKIFPKPTAEFRLPAVLSTPLVLIGPGTGIAPFMGFLEHRHAQVSSLESTDAANSVVEGTWRGDYELEADELPITKRDASGLNPAVDYRSSQDVGGVDVFFGCRHADHDWLYRDEMTKLRDEGIISNLYTAFSRDGTHRCYVQDIMRKDDACSSRLVDLILDKNASVYVCGDGNAMARDVQSAIVDLIARRKNSSLDEAKEYLEKMKAQKRFVMDIWTS